MATIDGWSFYKTKIEGKMTLQNIKNTCLENGMTAACWHPNHADSGCTTTPNNGKRSTVFALLQALCPNTDYYRCQAMNDGFWYMANYNGDSWGAHNGKSTPGNTLTSLYSMCTKQD